VRAPANVSGIRIDGSDNVIGGDRTQRQGNVVSGNGGFGIEVTGQYSDGTGSSNEIIGNLIGTDASGTQPFPNMFDGVLLSRGASDNRIGGLEAGQGNIVSGNAGRGVAVGATGGNFILGNSVGTDVTGTAALANAGNGIIIEGGAFDNVVQGNLSSGNGGAGICISDWGSDYNAVIGNRIGTDRTGTLPVPNHEGVFVGSGGSSFNRIGGRRAEDRNLISGNFVGVGLVGPATGNLVMGNFIGTDFSGTQSLGNDYGVVLLTNNHAVVGGTTSLEGNVIGTGGIEVGAGSNDCFVAGNHIGTDLSGRTNMGSRYFAAWVDGDHNVLQSNVITHSEGPGIGLNAGTYATIRRNSILENAGKGIAYWSGEGDVTPAPTITAVHLTEVSGTACPGCEVEIFSDEEDEGRLFEGSTVADASGHFVFATQRALKGPNVTATATDSQGGTSEFSAPSAVPPRPPRRRLVRRP
jgi:Periplasmic copper-binding protein (NosD)